MTKPNLSELVFFWILFGVVGLLAFAVMSPYLTPLFLAVVFSVVFSPVYRYVNKLVHGKESLAAFLTVLLVLCVVLIPLVLLGILMFQEVVTMYTWLAEDGKGFALVDNLTLRIQQYIHLFVPGFQLNIDFYTYIQGALSWIAVNLNTFFSGILAFVFQIFIVIVAMFFFYRDGKKLRDFAVKWSPLADSYDEGIMSKLELAISSVVKGSLATVTIQGALVGIGFAIFGVPNPVLWGTVATIVALIPFVGTGLITVPAVVMLFVSHHPFLGFGLLFWGIAVSLIDNILRPMFIRRGVDIHPFLIFLSVLGGLAYFGPVGFAAGPIILAFLFALMDIYPQIINGRAIKNGESIDA